MGINVLPAYHIERSVFKLNRTQSNVNRTIKFDVVRSSNEIELTKNKCKSNQIERSIKSDEVRFSSVAEAVERDRGAGDREKRGREVYGRREKRGREAGFPRQREAGEKGKNYATLRNISGVKKYRAGTGIEGYGKREV